MHMLELDVGAAAVDIGAEKLGVELFASFSRLELGRTVGRASL
jgi:hypothetical protein